MYLSNIPATIEEAWFLPKLRVTVAHELVHLAQCSVKAVRGTRLLNGTELTGPWMEAIPNTIALETVGGAWWIGTCLGPEAGDRASKVLDGGRSGFGFGLDDASGYGDWLFWSHLLGPRLIETYKSLLKEVATSSKGGKGLETVIRKRYSDAQLRDALLAWMSDAHFGGSRPSLAGNPIRWGMIPLTNDPEDLESEYVSTTLSPTLTASATRSVEIPAMSCAKVLVEWPDDLSTMTVAVEGPTGVGMVAGADAGVGRPVSAPCGDVVAAAQKNGTPPYRVTFPVSNMSVTASRPCAPKASGRGAGPTRMWVLLANGSRKTATISVTATAS